MRKFLFSALSTLAVLAFILVSSTRARAQSDDARPDSAAFTYQELVGFTGTSGNYEGATPGYGSLIQASDGNYYGTTGLGGLTMSALSSSTHPRVFIPTY